MLIISLGQATRLTHYIQAQPKRYVAGIVLGATSTTDDTEGQIIPTPGATAPDESQVRRVLAAHTGSIQQVPPNHSAVWVDGQRAYDLARSGKDTGLQARPVEIHSIDLLAYDYPRLEIAIVCGSGTYIRSLGRDIGGELGCGGYCDRLVRTTIGAFDISQAKLAEDLVLPDDILPPSAAVAHLPQAVVDEAGARIVSWGNAQELGEHARIDGEKVQDGTEVVILDASSKLLATGTVKAKGDSLVLQPGRVFFPRYGK